MKIDLTYLESISGGDKAFMSELLTMYRKTTPKDMEMVRYYFNQRDFEMVSSSAHKIKAPVEMLGQPELVSTIVELEKAGKAGDEQKMPALIAKVEIMVDELDKEVSKLLDSWK